MNKKGMNWILLINIIAFIGVTFIVLTSFFAPDEDIKHKFGGWGAIPMVIYFLINFFWYRDLRKLFISVLSTVKLAGDEVLKFKKKFENFDMRFNISMTLAFLCVALWAINTYGIFMSFRLSELLLSISFIVYLIADTIMTKKEKDLREEIIQLKTEEVE